MLLAQIQANRFTQLALQAVAYHCAADSFSNREAKTADRALVRRANQYQPAV